MNPNQPETKFSIRINPSSDRFGLIRIVARIKSDKVRSIFYRFLSNELQNIFRIGSEWFALAQIQISECIGIILIGSEWTPIRYFRQGNFLIYLFIYARRKILFLLLFIIIINYYYYFICTSWRLFNLINIKRDQFCKQYQNQDLHRSAIINSCIRLASGS